MLDAHEYYGNPEYLQSIEKAGDFIILSQYPPPQAGWGQQYNHSLEIDWARSFEPPAVCSNVTRRNIDTLVDLYLYTGKEKYLDPIPAAVQWLENSRLPDEEKWARFYELETNIPIYCDYDRKIVYDINELGEERRTGYSWQDTYGIESAIRYYNDVKELGREEYLRQKEEKLSESEKNSRLKSLGSSATKIINSQDENGRWISDDRIKSSVFNSNVNKLCDYIETYYYDIETYYYDDEGIPMRLDSYELYQNYPNPFNSQTQIEYKVSENTNIKIEIYNIIGKKIKTLINSIHSPGYHEVYWDGTNNIGQTASSGQYIALFRAGGYTQTIKIIYIR